MNAGFGLRFALTFGLAFGFALVVFLVVFFAAFFTVGFLAAAFRTGFFAAFLAGLRTVFLAFALVVFLTGIGHSFVKLCISQFPFAEIFNTPRKHCQEKLRAYRHVFFIFFGGVFVPRIRPLIAARS